jgi:hypothetical protein
MDTFNIGLIFAGIIFIGGLLVLIKKVQLTSKMTITVKKIFIFLCSVLVIAIILAQFDIYFRGYWTTKFFIWLFILTASFLFVSGNRKVFSKAWRIFTGFIFYFPIASILWFFIVPFMGPVISLTIWGRILGDPADCYYNDNEIRIQRVFKGALGPAGPPYYFKKRGIFEFDKGIMSVNLYEDPDSLKIEKTKDSITAYFYHHSSQDISNPISFKFKR